MTRPQTNQCSAQVYHSGDWHSSPCQKAPTTTEKGKPYCTIHAPSKVEARRAEWDKAEAELKKAAAEWDKVLAEWKKASAEWKKALAMSDEAFAERNKASAMLDKTFAERKKALADRNKALAEHSALDAYCRREAAGALQEQARRAACYDELLGACKAVIIRMTGGHKCLDCEISLPVGSGGMDHDEACIVHRVKEAIARARNEKMTDDHQPGGN